MARETVDIPEVARRLGVGVRQAYEAAREDRLPLPVIRIGRLMVVSRAALNRLLGTDVD